MHKKEGSSVRPKTSMLEKALCELEKMVAECKIGYLCSHLSWIGIVKCLFLMLNFYFPVPLV